MMSQNSMLETHNILEGRDIFTRKQVIMYDIAKIKDDILRLMIGRCKLNLAEKSTTNLKRCIY